MRAVTISYLVSVPFSRIAIRTDFFFPAKEKNFET